MLAAQITGKPPEAPGFTIEPVFEIRQSTIGY
jgi:hypothetical protein